MQSILELIFKTSKQGRGGKQAAAELKNLKGTVGEVTSGLLGFNAANVTAAGAIIALGGYVKGSVDKFVEYGKAVSEMAAKTGTGVEETSRMIQTLDDFGLAQDKVNTLVGQAANKGFVMSIDNIANLADQYNSLNTQEEKNALMKKTLGKAGTELNKVMEAGSEAIREAAAAQAEGLILTEQEAAEAEKLRQNIDTLNDSFDAVALTIGGTFAGAINGAIERSEQLQKLEDAGVKLSIFEKAFSNTAIAAMELAESEEWVATHSRDAMEMIKGTGDAASGAIAPMEDLATATYSASDVMKAYNEQLLFSIASEGLSADEALNLATKMGLVDGATQLAYEKTAVWKKMMEEGALTADGYTTKVLAMKEAMDRLEDKTVTLTMNVKSNYAFGSSDSELPGVTIPGPVRETSANGSDFIVPPGYPNDSFTMGLSSGEHVRVENDRMRWTGEGGGAPVINFNGPIQVDSEANYQRTLRRLSQDITNAMRNN